MRSQLLRGPLREEDVATMADSWRLVLIGKGSVIGEGRSGMAAVDSWNSVSKGVNFVGRLVAAVAIINVLSRAATVPVSEWLGSALNAYAVVFHPIVDATAGLVPRMFGYQLLPIAEDAILAYAILCASFYRVGKNIDEDESALTALGLSLIWPIYICWGLMVLSVFSRVFPEEQGTTSRAVRILAKGMGKELAIILAVVAAAALFNAAGVL